MTPEEILKKLAEFGIETDKEFTLPAGKEVRPGGDNLEKQIELFKEVRKLLQLQLKEDQKDLVALEFHLEKKKRGGSYG